MTEKQLEKYNQIMVELQELWEKEFLELKKMHNNRKGLKSTQLGAFVIYLIEKGIIR